MGRRTVEVTIRRPSGAFTLEVDPDTGEESRRSALDAFLKADTPYFAGGMSGTAPNVAPTAERASTKSAPFAAQADPANFPAEIVIVQDSLLDPGGRWERKRILQLEIDFATSSIHTVLRDWSADDDRETSELARSSETSHQMLCRNAVGYDDSAEPWVLR